MRFGFCGPSYQSQSVAADAQTCMNLYIERDESGAGKSEWQLLHTPGLRTEWVIPGMSRIRKIVQVGSRIFAVAENTTDQYLYELLSDGQIKALPTIIAQIDAVNVSSNNLLTLTVLSSSTAGRTLAIGDELFLSDFPNATFLNNQTITISHIFNQGDGSPAFFVQASFVHPAYTNNESGLARTLAVTLSTFQLGTAGFPVSVAYNQADQLLICSGTRVFLYDLSTNTMTEISTSPTGTAIQGPVSQIGYTDGYFLALLKDSQVFQISGLLDGSSWNPLDKAQVSLYQDHIISMVVDHREIWFAGPKQTVGYFNTGDNNFPFSPISSAFIESGSAAQFGAVKADNTIYWIGADERGAGIVWRAQGYTPQRVSTHALETAWAGYERLDDAEGFSYQDQGHLFIVWQFPTANKTWVFDVASSQWHERAHLTAGAHLAGCHAFINGKHLVGDRQSGNIYEMSTDFQDDAGTAIQRVRRAPYINTEDEWVPYTRFVLDMETGLGPQPPLLDGLGNPREPQVSLRWSDDSGHKWSNYHTRGAGKAGEYRRRVKWTRLGHSRQRVFEVSITDPIPVRITDAYINEPTDRIVNQARRSA